MNLDWAEGFANCWRTYENEIMNQGLYEELTKLVTSKLEELDKDTFK
jgi:hypothetical protein